MRTTNMLERLNEEIKRRTRVAGLFPNEASLLRLVGAMLMETTEEGGNGKEVFEYGRGERNNRFKPKQNLQKKCCVIHKFYLTYFSHL